jgi:hypothetical protein
MILFKFFFPGPGKEKEKNNEQVKDVDSYPRKSADPIVQFLST